MSANEQARVSASVHAPNQEQRMPLTDRCGAPARRRLRQVELDFASLRAALGESKS
jgi:hypothetical protein